MYCYDGLTYQSNYGAGLWVHDVSSIPDDPTGGSVEVSAFFDIYPEDDAVGGISQFVGTWSHYGPFPSGYIMINTIERGAYVVKHRYVFYSLLLEISLTLRSKFNGKAHGKHKGRGRGRQ
jgi:hypothetical protein